MLKAVVTTLPMIVCVVMAVQVALVLRQESRRALPLLLLFLLDASLLYVCHFVYFNAGREQYPQFAIIYRICNLTVWPLYLIYIFKLTQRSLRWIAIGAAVTALFVVLGLMWEIVAKVLFAIEVLATVAIGHICITHYNRRLDTLYADNEGRNLTHLTVLLWLMLATSVISLLCNAVGRAYFIDHIVLLAGPSVMFSALLFSIAWAGLNIKFSIIDIEHDPKEEQLQLAPAVGNDTIRNIAESFDRIMTERRLYLQHNIKVDEVAQQLCTNRTYIYHALTDYHHTSFSDYVNSRRISYAIELQAAHPELAVADVAEQSGFASTSAYYRNLAKFGPRNAKP